jgi:hypothetical protein
MRDVGTTLLEGGVRREPGPVRLGFLKDLMCGGLKLVQRPAIGTPGAKGAHSYRFLRGRGFRLSLAIIRFARTILDVFAAISGHTHHTPQTRYL